MKTNDRYVRQSVLPEVGTEGQSRLFQATYSPDSTLSPTSQAIAAKYALACGIGTISAPHEPETRSLATHFRHESSRDVGLAAADVLGAAWALLRSTDHGNTP